MPVASLPEARPLASLSHQAPAQRQGPLPEQQPGSLAPQARPAHPAQLQDGALVLSLAFGMKPSPEREALWAAWAARLPQHRFASLQGRRRLPQPPPLPQPVCRQWAASNHLHLLPASAGVGAMRRSRGSLSQLSDGPASQVPWDHLREDE